MIIIGIVLVLVIVVLALHSKIIDWITPASNHLRDMKGGWAIPIGILIILSFPPLFGHEIIQIMCGVVWGVWKGFLIAAAGTLLGEIALWFVSMKFFTKKMREIEEHRLFYACMYRVVREGGFFVVLVIRYSAIPPHFSTGLFAACGVSFWIYLAAAVLSLPKQFATVYLGVVAAQKHETKWNKLLSVVVIVVTSAVTLIAMHWLFKKMDHVRPLVIAEKHNAKAEEGVSGGLGHMRNDSGDALLDGHERPGHVYPMGRPVMGSAPGYSPAALYPPSRSPPPRR